MEYSVIGHDTKSVLTKRLSRDAILDNLGQFWGTSDIRYLAQTLLRLADCTEQGWRPEQIVANQGWSSEALALEKDGINLALKAQVLQSQIDARSRHFPFGIFSDPPWAMMLELFVQSVGGAKVSLSTLEAISDCEPHMAKECLSCLVAAGLFIEHTDNSDGAEVFYSLAEESFVRTGRLLTQMRL